MIRLATTADLPELRAAIRASDRVAIDTEFHAERRFVPALYLIQLRLGSGDTWVVDPLVPGLVSDLAEALRSVPWVLHGGRWDMEVLQVALGGLPDHVWDTQIAAALVRPWWPMGYASLVEEFLGLTVDKSVTLSDWSRRPLTEEQVAYAAADVASLFDLWDRLEDELRALDRVQLAQAACDEARQEVVEPAGADEAWRAIHARVSLDPQQLCVLQEIAAWRRERAVAQNQPERSVLSDGAVLELARRQPLTRSSLVANRRLPRALHKNAEELLERIARASQRPEWAWPRAVRRRTAQWQQLSFLEVWAMAHGCRHRFAGSMVLPRRALEDSVLAESPAAAREQLGPWREELAGAALELVLQGSVSMAIDPAGVRLTPSE